MLYVHHMILVSFSVFCKKIGQLAKIFGHMVNPPSPAKKNCTYAYVPMAMWMESLAILGSKHWHVAAVLV